MEDLSAFSAKPRLRLLLDHFAKIKDTRQAWKVAYPLREVLFLVLAPTKCWSCPQVGLLRALAFGARYEWNSGRYFMAPFTIFLIQSDPIAKR
jgi:hypothetical protein